MFGDLHQGSPIFILDKTNKPIYKIGEIISVKSPIGNFDTSATKSLAFNQVYLDVKVKIDNEVQEYNSIPSNYSVITYNSGKIMLSDSKASLQSEIENSLQHNRHIVENIDTIKQEIVDYEGVLKQINPQFAKDKERDDKIAGLEGRMNTVDDKLNKVIELLQNK